MNFDDWRSSAKSLSVILKIAAGIAGLAAAYLWYRSAVNAEGAAAASWNMWAAIVSGVSMFFQAASAIIDAIVAPSATFA